MYYAVYLVFRSLYLDLFFFGLCYLIPIPQVCFLILTNVPNLFNFQHINFCPKLYMDISFSLIKPAIIVCDSVLGMKYCNGEVLKWGIGELFSL